MPAETIRPVFLSYASEDKATAAKLSQLLEDRGIRCWYAPRDVPPGADWAEAVLQGIDASCAVVVLLSAHAMDSLHVRNEIGRAHTQQKKIIPIRIDKAELSAAWQLFSESTQWIEADASSWESVVERLRQVIMSREQVQPMPPFPPSPPKRRMMLRWGIGIGAALVVLLGLWMSRPGRGVKPSMRRDGSVVSVPVETAVDRLEYRALVVGINEYAAPSDTGWTSLRSARADAEAVAQALAEKYGFRVNLLVDRQATRQAIISGLDTLLDSGPNAAVVVYFAGHGFYDEALQEGYWIPSDARRRVGNRNAHEDWIWNSTIQKIIGSSRARHVLVIADDCYSGSLFRGSPSPASAVNASWYANAITRPSRFLITSGNLEPVPDSTGQHSEFAQEVVNFLQDPQHEVFSASEMGQAIKDKMAMTKGQNVQFGSLALGGNQAAGEFVFLRRGAHLPQPTSTAAFSPPPVPSGGVSNLPAVAPGGSAAPAAMEPLLQQALYLNQQGATGAALRVMAEVSGKSGQHELADAVASYLDRQRQTEAQGQLRQLIQTLRDMRTASRGTNAAAVAFEVKPRILACLGPVSASEGPAAGSDALLLRLGLEEELRRSARMQVVEREALEQILQEMQIGASDLADPRARMEIGRLLPAGLLLLGDIMMEGAARRAYMRLVNTETTSIVGTFSESWQAGAGITEICKKLAREIETDVIRARPLVAPVVRVQGNRLTADIGQFHGVRTGVEFDLFQRNPSAGTNSVSPESSVGKAQVVNVNQLSCELTAVFNPGIHPTAETLWLRETSESH